METKIQEPIASQNTQIPIWLDCDPGHDDAMAIILAGYNPKINLLGISTVAGNQVINKVTQNALSILELAGLNHIDVLKGSASPLLRFLDHFKEVIHGESGLDGAQLPISPKQPLEKNAIIHIYETLTKHIGKVTLVATGMLTNVALLLKTFPDVKNNLEEIVLMGGAMTIGNVTPAAEFNIWLDPEAADIVFNCGLMVTMVPLEVTHTAIVTKDILKEIVMMNTKLANDIASFLLFFADAYFKIYQMEGAPLHDPCAVAYVINKELFECQLMHVHVERKSEACEGRTVCDIYNRTKKPKNVNVCKKIDYEGFWKLMMNAIKSANEKSKYGKGAESIDII